MPRELVQTHVTVVVHYSDFTRLTNTGKWVPVVLANSEILVRGQKESPLDISRAILPDHHNAVLFPSKVSRALSPEYLESVSHPINLIVPDGNWNQAGKMEKREKKLAQLPRVHLEYSKPTRYRLRTAAHENWIPTFEAVARSLGIIESARVQEKLEWFFDVAVERVLYLKGRLDKEDVTGGLSREMIDQYHIENNDQVYIEALKKAGRYSG